MEARCSSFDQRIAAQLNAALSTSVLKPLRHSRRGTIIGRITRPGMAHQERPKGRRPCPYFDFFGTRVFG
jgi:hypothetical protein